MTRSTELSFTMALGENTVDVTCKYHPKSKETINSASQNPPEPSHVEDIELEWQENFDPEGIAFMVKDYTIQIAYSTSMSLGQTSDIISLHDLLEKHPELCFVGSRSGYISFQDLIHEAADQEWESFQ
jgi:hypothetical protein